MIVGRASPQGPAGEPDPGTPESPLLAAVRRPIPGGTGCGIDVSYDDDYLAIKAEIDKLGTVSTKVDQERAAELRQMLDAARGSVNKAGRSEAERQLEQRGSMVNAAGGPDYLVIRARAERILGEKSKDLRVATYLAFALWQTEAIPGLAEGMQAIDLLVRQYWEGLYPSKARAAARRNAVDFLASKLGETLEYAPVRETDRAPLELLQKVLAGLQEEFARQMPEGPPSLLGMLQGVEKCLRRIPRPSPITKPAPVPPPEKAAAAPAAERPAPEAATPAGAVPGTTGEFRSNQDAVDAIRRVSRFLRDQNRFNPTSFRLLRSLRWDGLTTLPPNEKGKTKFEPPPAQRRTYLAGLGNASDWPKLLDECEASFMQPGFHLWLDLQRLVAAALEGLGAEARAARQAILFELALLTRRLPGLTGLTF
ncbi:MAG TPA: TssA family type VI secretion system protein, partial [Bacteroidota bacterium]